MSEKPQTVTLSVQEVHRTGLLSGAVLSDHRAGESDLRSYGRDGVDVEVEVHRGGEDIGLADLLDSLELGDRVEVQVRVVKRVAEVNAEAVATPEGRAIANIAKAMAPKDRDVGGGA